MVEVAAMTGHAIEHVQTSDGYSIEILLMPPQAGWTLLFHGGCPSAPVAFPQLERAAAARAIRLVEYARPGYASSTRRIGRRVADAASDVVAILDSVGAERCLTLGWSAGGPHALACAGLLPERIAAAGTIASPAPYGVDGLDFFAGMSAGNVEEFEAAVAAPERLQAMIEAAAPSFTSVTADQARAALGDLVSDEDREALTGEFAEHVAAAFRGGLSGGIWGWYDDDLALANGWGFDLASIQVPVTIWQGDHDRMVPPAHGRWLAEQIAGVRAQFVPDQGHLSLAAQWLDRILDDLLERAGR
jgi:pimeloyl-ACP methyl ester carboxylesterase